MTQQYPLQTLASCRAGEPPEQLLAGKAMDSALARASGFALGPGDRVRLTLAGDDGLVTGLYVVGPDGSIVLPGTGRVPVQGLDEMAAGNAVFAALRQRAMVRGERTFLDLRLDESAGVWVQVGGAVFDPGRVRAGERSAEALAARGQGNPSGDENPMRTLAGALRAAGGLRPDADVSRIYLVRGAQWTRIDLLGLLTGGEARDVIVQAGDRIFVPSTGCFDARLVRPSAVTAPGIRVYMSNLTRPAASNASSAIGKETTSLPYGTRFLQGLVDMNCVGGSAMNKNRRAVLISRNPMNGQSIAIQRNIEDLVRGADRDARDPYLMPGDALACYDSGLSNVQDVVSLLGNVAGVAATTIILEGASN
ncbi:polysaccharide biosynthesis/export family protein [Novosphingobium profundi]|uniref:polysaccharide biosynthesis/export family protein n=1 Tax=Novosphingobium profundi TaxID=1774954 RepID=UPI001FE29A73|nr:polysaccharide biosynthesis/export family protein [Novosphingobium profundi]